MPNLKVSKVKKIVPRKSQEFDLFLYILEQGQGMHLGQIAEALGVVPETLSEWRKDPRSIQAQAVGVIESLNKMKSVGAEDWRMWKDKLALSGITEVKRTDLTSLGEKIEIPILGGITQQNEDSGTS